MKYVSTLLFFVLAALCVAQKTALPADVVSNIQQRIDQGINPAIAIGIFDADGEHYYNFGLTKTGGRPVDEHSIFEIGSITKTFTAILLADMVEKGKLNLDDPISKFLPATVTVPYRADAQITLGHLSDHTSSLPRMPDNMTPADPLNPYADYTVEQMYAFLSSYTLTRDIGSEYEYSNFAQGLLGHILSLQAGMSYEDLMLATIASPLKMSETGITLSDNMRKHLATPHSQGIEVSNWDLPTLAGAGAIRSSTSDMLKYLAANLGLTENRLTNPMQVTHQSRHDKGGMRVGLAWHIRDGAEGDVIWHNGGTGGYRAFAGFVNETGRGVVLFTNSDIGVDDIGFHLLDSNSELQTIRPHVARELRKHIDSEGVNGVEAKFAELKQAGAEKYDFSEMDINALGYYYLQLKNVDAALAIFKINTIEYPGSANVWDSFGEALMEKGETAAAIENYQKSLVLNPGNTNAVAMLEKLGIAASIPEIQVSEDILQTYLGNYELMPGFSIVVTHDGAQLYGQATGQAKFELFPKTETEFYLKVVDAQIKFNKNDVGVVESLTLFQGGQVLEGKKSL
ncbi:MAG TPA: serine hydrolase [Saprospiraceae bacterium]|nr:serine hydrolase [Saprospiraceae bacterium]